MSRTVTVIGGATAVPARPTRFGEVSGPVSPPPAVLKPTPMPTAIVAGGSAGPVATPIGPSVLGGAAGPDAAPRVASPVPAAPASPTLIQPTTPMPPPGAARGEKVVAVGAPIQASALPGAQRKPIVVTVGQLGQRFPGLDCAVKEQVQALLAGISPSAMDTGAWLNYGASAQEELAKLVKARLALMESSPTRGITQHLRQLQKLLSEVLDAMSGKLFSRSPLKVWAAVDAEVMQLEELLTQATTALVGMIQKIEELRRQNLDAGRSLQAHALTGEYLADLVSPEVGSVLLSRIAALNASQALMVDQVHALALDVSSVQELATLVQDGVLLKLPAMYSQLAGLSAKPSDTQRFMAAESLTEIITTLQRKL